MFLSLVFHNHQPVGQLPWSFEDAWRDAYSPFLEVLEKHPNVKIALHFTGPLLDWLCEHKPETIAQIRVLVARNQVEILSGGYYEPILAIWPRADQLAQMKKLNARVAELFGRNPRGMWLAERVWEPQLASAIRQSALEFTFVDGSVFESAGVRIADSFDLFQVKTDGEIEYSNDARQNNAQQNDAQKLTVFPINGTLRDLIPWRAPAETIEFLRGIHERKGDDALVVFADDGEKFGAWPGTFHFIYENANDEKDAKKARGWLDSFFTVLEENADWLQTATPSQIVEARLNSSTRNVDLPAGSYAEMQSWSGGNWRNFLQKYHESRDLFDEVSRVSERVSELVSTDENVVARDLVLQAQCNDALWHGAFGGLYLRHLRQAIYAKTIEAQVLIEGNSPFVRVREETNGDWSLENEQIRVGVRARGGHIWNWTSKAARHNVLSTLRRHREPYHAPDAPVDWYARGALLDHFFGEVASPELFAHTRFPEQGDFVSETWQIETKSSNESASIVLKRDGGVWCNGAHQPLSIRKTLSLQPNSETLNIEYSIRNNSNVELALWWANEWNIAMSGTDAPTRHYHGNNHKTKLRLDETANFWEVTNPIVADSWLHLQVEWSFAHAMTMWHIPIWSISQKEGGDTEKTHQSSAFVFLKRLHLLSAIEYSIKFTAALNS